MADRVDRGNWLPADTGPLVGLRVSVSPYPWRIGPAWAVFAGALAAGASLLDGPGLLRLVGALCLADPAWGAVWAALAAARPRVAGWRLPYLQPTSPLARLGAAGERLAHGTVPAAVLVIGLAALLGTGPLVVSLVALAVALAAQLLANQGTRPFFCYAALSVGLPWAVGMALSGRPMGQLLAPLAVAVAFTLLEWGATRSRCSATCRSWSVWLGQGAVLAALVLARLPWAVCVVAGLMLPPSWWLLHRQREGNGQDALAAWRGSPWWWAAMLVAALALRQLVMS